MDSNRAHSSNSLPSPISNHLAKPNPEERSTLTGSIDEVEKLADETVRLVFRLSEILDNTYFAYIEEPQAVIAPHICSSVFTTAAQLRKANDRLDNVLDFVGR